MNNNIYQEEIQLPPQNISELYIKIMKDLPTFKTSEELKNELFNMKKNSDDAIEEFRKILLDFTDIVINITDSALVKRYKDDIIKSINQYPKKIIDTFIIHGYMENDAQYRKEIIIGNDDFFLGEKYNKYTNGDSSIMNYISQFKNFWHKLDNDNKFLIKTFLVTLCHYSDKRFMIFQRYTEIKKMYKNSYESIFSYFDVEI